MVRPSAVRSIRASAGWSVEPVAMVATPRRSAAPSIEQSLQQHDLALAQAFDIRPTRPAGQRPAALTLKAALDEAGERLVLMVRHPSGAISFHPPRPVAPRRRAAAARLPTLEFEIAVRAPAHTSLRAQDAPRGHRRRALYGVLRGFLFKLLGPALPPLLSELLATHEAESWRRRGLREGLMRVVGDGADFRLQPVRPSADELAQAPSLLLLHGTFSDTAGSFGALAASGFIAQARARYGSRIFAFEHFSISRSLDDNLALLLAALPAGHHRLDVIGYSRGALLARRLYQAPVDAGGARVEPGRVVLIAGPHCGTHLASPQRYVDTLGWFANLIELFPDNPLTSAISWISASLAWLAQHLIDAAPGLRDMDPDGDSIHALMRSAATADGRIAAVVAQFEPEARVAARLLDVAADGFFGGANDLVVPTRGGFHFAADERATIPPQRLLQFGPSNGPGIHHLNLMGQAATAAFCLAHLADDGSTRRTASAGMSATGAGTLEQADTVVPAAAGADAVATIAVPEIRPEETFHLLVLAHPDAEARSPYPAQVVASFGGASVIEPYTWKNRAGEVVEFDAGHRWSRIIAGHHNLLKYFNGERHARPFTEPEQRDFGAQLFDALFKGEVGRLYDEARGRMQSRRINVVLSSDVPRWAGKPWEFAYDRARGTYLATQDIHLLRDVPFMIPTDRIAAHAGPLRILVVNAQPVDAAMLSVEDEQRLIRRPFQPLIDAGLVQMHVLARATPAMLHREFETAARPWDVLHFIGHGLFDEAEDRGKLLFEDEGGARELINERQLAEILGSRELRLVFLNACESARGGDAEFARGVAPALLRAGIPAVIANQFSVLDSAALMFAGELYQRLARGNTVAQAVREARIALNYRLGDGTLDWAVPALFTRMPDMRLVMPLAATSPPPLPATALTTQGRRAGASPARGSLRVGVWDASRRLPDLAAWLVAFNAAQSSFDFELVELAIPLDATTVVEAAPIRFLDAPVTRERLRRQLRDHGLDRLIALTQLPMKDHDRLYVPAACGRHARADASPVMLFSYYGLDVPARGQDAQSLIANVFVRLLAAHEADLQTHQAAPHCAPFDAATRDLALLLTRTELPVDVRGALKLRHPDLLTSLEALLALVPGKAPRRPPNSVAASPAPRKRAKRAVASDAGPFKAPGGKRQRL